MRTITFSLCAIFLSLLFISDSIGQSKKSKKLFNEAEKQYNNQSYLEAINTLRDLLSNESDFPDAQYLLGKSYYEIYNFPAAKEHFELLINQFKYENEEVRYMLGMTLKALGDYDNAKANFENFVNNTINANMRRMAELELAGIQLAMEFQPGSGEFEFQNAGDQINTQYSEHAVTFAGSPKKIVVSRYSSPEKENSENIKYQLAQIWMRVNEGDEFEFLNTSSIEGAGVIGQNEDYYFTYCKDKDAKCQIYYSKKEEGIWRKASPLEPGVFPSTNNYIHPELSQNGDTLFFSSDRRGGLGGFDIWYSVRNEDEAWTDPINLGEPVNTVYDEKAPFLSKNGIFYFSSNGHPSFGLNDIFYVEGLNGQRSIHNLGHPFNSSMDDMHFKLLENVGFLVSNRSEGFGDYDIYTFKDHIRKEEAEELSSSLSTEDMEQVYSVLFNSELYQINPKFIGEELVIYSGLNSVLRQDLHEKVDENYRALSAEKIGKIYEDDKILMASLSRDERFFVERLAAAYFENEKALSLSISAEDEEHYNNFSLEDKRKFYRLTCATINELRGGAQPSAVAENQLVEKTDQGELAVIDEEPRSDTDETIDLTVLTEDTEEVNESSVDIEQPLITDSDEIIVEDNEIVDGQKTSEPKAISDTTEPTFRSSTNESEDEVEERSQLTNDEKFTGYLGINSSVEFYQNLSFSDKKRVDRIMAIRLVNEVYTFNPGLSYQDRNYYQSLPANEKEIIERFKLYFRSWSKDKELSNLNSSDLNYLSSLDQEKREKVARIIVRRGIGVDQDDYVRFDGADWNRYKKFSETELTQIKDVATLLKSHHQFFDVALAYAGSGYSFNNNLAMINQRQTPVISSVVSSDPEISVAGGGHTYETIYFDPGEYRLRNEAIVALNELIEIYSQNPEISFALDAYSYEKGSEGENLHLSGLRANAAKKYMVNRGVPDYKIQQHVNSLHPVKFDQPVLKELTSRKLELKVLNSPNVYQSEYTSYLVQPGNTLYSLSKASGISLEDLMAINGLDDNTIYAYQPIRVRVDATLDPEYMVSRSIGTVQQQIEEEVAVAEEPMDERESEIDGTEVAEEEEQERGEDIMVINVQEEPKTQKIIYIVKKGDKLEEIASRYGTSVNSIMELNNLKKKKVKKGQKLTVNQVVD